MWRRKRFFSCASSSRRTRSQSSCRPSRSRSVGPLTTIGFDRPLWPSWWIARSIWRIGRPINSVKNSTSSSVPGTSAATCHAETRCARLVDSCSRRSSLSTNSVSIRVSCATCCRNGPKRSMVALASAVPRSSRDIVRTMSRASRPILTDFSVAPARLVSRDMSCRRFSMRRRSWRMIVRLSSLRRMWYWLVERCSCTRSSASRRLSSAARMPVLMMSALCDASLSRLTRAQITATSNGSATRPNPTRISPLSDLGRRNSMREV